MDELDKGREDQHNENADAETEKRQEDADARRARRAKGSEKPPKPVEGELTEDEKRDAAEREKAQEERVKREQERADDKRKGAKNLRMLTDVSGSKDGRHTHFFRVGEVHAVPSEHVSHDLARTFLEQGWAEKVGPDAEVGPDAVKGRAVFSPQLAAPADLPATYKGAAVKGDKADVKHEDDFDL